MRYVKRFIRKYLLYFDYFLLNLREYLKRLKKTIIAIAVLLIFLVLIALATANIINCFLEDQEFAQVLNDAAATAVNASVSDESEIPLSLILLIEAFAVTFLGFIFSGWFAKVFLTPVNCIKFAPFAVLREDKLQFRFWICRHNKNYLNDVSVTLGFTYNRMFDESTLFFEGRDIDPALYECDSEIIEQDERRSDFDLSNKKRYGFSTLEVKKYPSMLGVWNFDIPLDSPAGECLLCQFKKHLNEDPKIRISVQGLTSSGEVIGKSGLYNARRILYGYRFAKYHSPKEGSSDYEHYEIKRKEHLWFGHALKVIVDDDTIDRSYKHVSTDNQSTVQSHESDDLESGIAVHQYVAWKRILKERQAGIHYNGKKNSSRSLFISKDAEVSEGKRKKRLMNILYEFTCEDSFLWDASLKLKDVWLMYKLEKYI